MYSIKSVLLATVELCTSCSQKADREGLSLKSKMKFNFCCGGKKVFFLLVLMDFTSSCCSLNSFSFKWRCCSWVLLKSLWQKPVLTTHLSWNHLWSITSVMYSSTLSPWTEQNTDSHIQPNSVWLSVSMSVPYYLLSSVGSTLCI